MASGRLPLASLALLLQLLDIPETLNERRVRVVIRRVDRVRRESAHVLDVDLHQRRSEIVSEGDAECVRLVLKVAGKEVHGQAQGMLHGTVEEGEEREAYEERILVVKTKRLNVNER